MNSVNFHSGSDPSVVPMFKPGDIIEVDGFKKKYYVLSFTGNCEKGYYGAFQFIDIESGYPLLDMLISYKLDYGEKYSGHFGALISKLIYDELQQMSRIDWKYIGQCKIDIRY